MISPKTLFKRDLYICLPFRKVVEMSREFNDLMDTYMFLEHISPRCIMVAFLGRSSHGIWIGKSQQVYMAWYIHSAYIDISNSKGYHYAIIYW